MSPAQALLSVTVLPFLLGAVLYRFAGRSAQMRASVDGLALVSVGGLALVHLVPEAISRGGFAAIGFVFVGLIGPALLHRVSEDRAAVFADRVLILGLAVHAALESAALAAAHDDVFGLGIAIAAHRLPVGLAVFATARNQREGWLAIGLLVAASLVGIGGGQAIAGWLPPMPSAWLQAFVAGSLLHVLTGHGYGHGHGKPADRAERGREAVFGALGALAGFLLLAGSLGHPHGHIEAASIPGFLDTFATLALESAPALLIGYLLAGLLGVGLTQQRARWLGGGSSLSQSMRGVAFGLPLPICSCGVLPLYEALVRRGVPATAAIAFLIATPELGLDAILISIPLLGTNLTLARLAAAFVVALATSLVVGRLVRPSASTPSEDEAAQTGPLHQRVAQGLRFGLVELFDHTMPWIVTGLLVAALAEPLLGSGMFTSVPAWLQVPLFAVLGIPMYVCASAATPIAAVAIHKGISAGAALAFLIAGPATKSGVQGTT